MKKNYLLMTALAAITVFGAGCSKEEEESNELKVTTNIVKPSTKAILSEFSGSTIGVFVTGISNSTATVSTGANAVMVDPSIPINASTTVYAWYPTTTTETSPELTSPTSASTKDITVVSADDFSATDQTDYLYATPVDVTEADRTAELIFKHALSKVIFNIKKDTDFDRDGVLSKIFLKTTASDDTYKFLSGSGTMGIADGSISGLTATDNLTYTGSSAITLTTTAQEAVALVAPTTLAASTTATPTITISLTIDGIFYPGIFPVSSEFAWEAGSAYTYNITVDKNGGLIIGKVSITPWDTNTTETSLEVK